MLLSKILVFFRSFATVCLLCAGRRTTAGSCRWGTGSWSSPAPSGWREPCWYTIKALFTGFRDRFLLLLPVGTSWYTIKAHLTGITVWDAGFEPMTSLSSTFCTLSHHKIVNSTMQHLDSNPWPLHLHAHSHHSNLLFYPIALQVVAYMCLQYCTVHPPTL